MMRLGKLSRGIMRRFCSKDPTEHEQSTLLTDAEKQFDPTPIHLKPYNPAKYEIPLTKIKKNSGYALISIEPFPRASIMKIGYNILENLTKGIPEKDFFRVLMQERIKHIMSITDKTQDIQQLQEILGVETIQIFIQSLGMQIEVIEAMKRIKPWQHEDQKMRTVTDDMKFKPDPRYPIYKKGQGPQINPMDI